MPYIFGAALQIQYLSNITSPVQLQIIATTFCNESSHNFLHILEIVTLEFLQFEELCNVQDEGPLGVLTLARILCCMFTLHNITCFTNLSPVMFSWLKDKEARRQTSVITQCRYRARASRYNENPKCQNYPEHLAVSRV